MDRLTIAGSLMGLVSIGLNWFNFKPSRLESGLGQTIMGSAGWVFVVLLFILWMLCLLLSFRRQLAFSVMLGLASNAVLIASFTIISVGASNLIKEGPESARASPALGMWLTFLACYIVIFSAVKRVSGHRFLKYLMMYMGPAALVFFIISGSFDNLSLMVEFAAQRSRFYQEFLNHVYLVAVSVALGSFLGICLGILAAINRKIKNMVFFITNITQTIPSLALFGILMVPLSALSFRFEILREMGIRGIGNTPAIIALVIYSLLPVVRNTYTSIKQIDPAVIDAAKGMGMNRFQVFKRVQVPLSVPIVMEGIRIASVQSVGLAVVATLIGAGGLGWFIFQGLGQAAHDMVIFGTIPIIALALFTDRIMRLIISWLAQNKSKGGAQ